jgi:pimeloyl-ACP methyl ester carboxylesterase
MYLSSSKSFSLIMLTVIVLSCNSSNTKQSLNDLKDTVMESTSVEKSVQNAELIPGPAGKISVVQGGEGDIPILFLHSFGGSTTHWKKQMEHLSNRKTIAMDLRGNGRSDAPANNDYTIKSLVKDVETVVDSLHLDTFILVGHSMGGSVAIAYAAKHPEKVVGLLLAGTPGKTPTEQSKPIMASLRSDKYDTVMNEYNKKLLTHATPATHEMVLAGFKKINKEASISIIKNIFEYDALADLKKYNGPKWIVDIADMEEQPGSLHKSFPEVPYKTVTGTSHWIQLDKPDEFNKIVDEFLNEVEKK